jgi:hypothetical protein
MKLLLSLAAGVLSMLAFTLSREGYAGVSDPPLAAFSPVWILYALLLAGLWLLFFSLSIKPRFLCRPHDGANITYKRVSSIRATLGLAKPGPSEQAESVLLNSTYPRLGVSKGQLILGLCFGAVNYFATAMFAYDTWSYLNSFWQWGKAVLQILGQAAVMAMLAALVCRWLENEKVKEWRLGALREWISGGWLGKAYRRRPVLFAMGALLLCWSPYLVIFYPGTVSWDNGVMIGQFFGAEPLESWHPLFYTWLMGGMVAAGRWLAGDNLAAFLLVLLQSAALSYALARAVALLRRLGLGAGWQLAAFLFFGLTPIFASYAQAVYSDTLYTAVLLLFCVQVCELLRFGFRGAGQAAALAVSVLLCCMVRGIGLYVALACAAGLVAFGLRGSARLKIGAALAVPIALFVLFQQIALPRLGVVDVTSSAAYSLPFQQSARVLRDRPDTVTGAEYAEIDRVLDAENLPSLYETVISDPVKFTFRQYGSGTAAEQAALASYRETWLSMLRKYPLTYLETFVAGSTGYYAFTPKIDSARTYNFQGGVRFYFESSSIGTDPRYLHTAQIPAFAKARELLAMYARGWRRVPVLELFLFCAAYTWLLAIAALSILRQKRARDLAAFLPALLTLLTCVLSPVNDYFRYFLPIVAVFVPLLAVAKRELKRGI